MAKSLKKRGQKFIRKFLRASAKASLEGKEHIKENFLERLGHIQNIRLLIFEWGLLVLALIMLATTQAFWFTDSYAEDTFVAGGSYTEATVGRVNSMNPLFATTSSEKVLSRLMFATLARVDYSGNLGPGLASSIMASQDGQVWTLRLREGLKWSDGEPITNEDVMFTLGLIQNPAVNTIYTSNLENVKIAERENGEIVFTLPAPYADFVAALEIPIVPKHELEDATLKVLVEDDFSVAPVTSGAFMYNATQAVQGDESVIYLSGNPYYYLGGPELSSFAVHTYTDKNEVVVALNTGTVTASAELSELEADSITSGALERRESGVSAGVFAFFNTTTGAFRNLSLRRAVQQGVDMTELRAAAPLTNALDYPLTELQIDLASYPKLSGRNFEAARNVVAEKLGEGAAPINLVTVRSGYLPAVAEALKGQLEALGFAVNLTVSEETQDFITGTIARRDYDILIYEVELGAEPDLLPYYHSSQASASGLNLSNYRNTLVDDLLIGARETLDSDLRARKYESFLEYWANDVPALGIYQANMTYIYNKNVRTYGENVRLTTALDRFTDVENWAAVRGILDKTP